MHGNQIKTIDKVKYINDKKQVVTKNDNKLKLAYNINKNAIFFRKSGFK